MISLQLYFCSSISYRLNCVFSKSTRWSLNLTAPHNHGLSENRVVSEEMSYVGPDLRMCLRKRELQWRNMHTKRSPWRDAQRYGHVKTKRSLGRKLPHNLQRPWLCLSVSRTTIRLFLLFPLNSGATLSKPWVTNELPWPHKWKALPFAHRYEIQLYITWTFFMAWSVSWLSVLSSSQSIPPMVL